MFFSLINQLAKFVLRFDGKRDLLNNCACGHRFGNEIVHPKLMQIHNSVFFHINGKHHNEQLGESLPQLAY